MKGGDVPANYVMKIDTKIMSDEVKKSNVEEIEEDSLFQAGLQSKMDELEDQFKSLVSFTKKMQVVTL